MLRRNTGSIYFAVLGAEPFFTGKPKRRFKLSIKDVLIAYLGIICYRNNTKRLTGFRA